MVVRYLTLDITIDFIIYKSMILPTAPVAPLWLMVLVVYDCRI